MSGKEGKDEREMLIKENGREMQKKTEVSGERVDVVKM